MKIDGFDPSRVIDQFRNVRGRIAGPAGQDLRADLKNVREALRTGQDPEVAKAAIGAVHTDLNAVVDLQQIRDGIQDVRNDFKSGVAPEQLKGDLQSLKDQLKTFVEESGGSADARGIAQTLREALRATFHHIRGHQEVNPTPTPVEPDPAVVDSGETVGSGGGAVDLTA